MVFRNSLPIWWLWTRCLWNIFLHEQWSVRNKPVVFVLLPQCVITRCKSCNFLFCVSVCLQGPVRKSLSRVDKQMRRFADIRRLTKTGHAVKISVEGNRMPLWFFFFFFFFPLNSVGFIVFTFYCFVSEQTRSFALLRSSSALLKKGAVVRPCWLQFKCVICCKLVCPLNKTRERLQNDPKITFPNANSLIICFIVQLVLAVSLISLTWKSAIVAVLTNTGIT